MKLPIMFEEKMRGLLGGEMEAYLACFDEPRYYGLRVNTGKISVEEFRKLCPFDITPIPWIENGFYYDIPGKTSLLFCRTVLSSGAKRHDSGQSSAH